MTDSQAATLEGLTEVVVPVEDPSAPDRGLGWAERLAPQLGLRIRTVHVEVPSDAPAGAVEDAIVAELGEGSLIVMESEHADRWSGKASIAEHVVDRSGHIALVVGPCVDPDADVDAGSTFGSGPVLVALDGSSSAERALQVATEMAARLGRSVEAVRVCPEPLGHPDQAVEAAAEARRYLAGLDVGATTVVSSNDPVSALAQVVAERSAGLIVLASRGDRSTPRPVMAKTCSGLVAQSPVPVLVVGVA